MRCARLRPFAATNVQATSGLQHLAPPPQTKPSFASKITACSDLASLHRLLIEHAAAREGPDAQLTTGPTPAQPRDVTAAFQTLAKHWRRCPQQPLDAVLLSDALRCAYALLSPLSSSLTPRQTAAIIISMQGMRSANVEVLRQLAESLAKRPPPTTSNAPTPSAPYSQPTAPAAPDSPAAASVSHGSSSSPALTRLTSQELAECVFTLAEFSVRPSEAWLGAAMSDLQLGLVQLGGKQLAQLLWALVRLGVRPTSPWLALYEEALCTCLELPYSGASSPSSSSSDEGAAEFDGSGDDCDLQESASGNQQQEGPQQALGCEDVVRVLRSAAEINFQPGARCRQLLLAAAGGRLRSMQPHQVAGLAWPLARLGWPVPEEWGREYVLVSSWGAQGGLVVRRTTLGFVGWIKEISVGAGRGDCSASGTGLGRRAQ